MKWAIFIPRFLPEMVGGNFVYVDRFSKALIRRGEEVHIFTTTLDKTLPLHDNVDSVKIHRILVNSGYGGSLRFSATRKITECFLMLDEGIRFDIVNVHAPFQINLRKVRKTTKIIYTLHAVLTHEYLFEIKKMFTTGEFTRGNLKEIIIFPLKLPICYLREVILLRRSSFVIVMSNYVKRCVLHFFGFVNPSKILISEIGINRDEFRPAENKKFLRNELGVKHNEIIFFTVRRLSPRMGLLNLIKAFAIFKKIKKDIPTRLIIAGKGPMRKRLESLVCKFGLENSVQLVGFLPDAVLLKYYQVSDVFILPTEELEGFGIVTIEALACNLPVIATPIGANPEVAGRFCPELLTESIFPNDIAEKISMITDNIDLYRGIDYRSKMESNYNWDKIIVDLERRLS